MQPTPTPKFSVRQTMADADLQPFPYEDAQGNIAYLPHIGTMPPGLAARFTSGDFEGALEEAGMEALLDVPSHALPGLMEAWYEHCGIGGDEPGKSPAPSRSAGRTGTSSRPTSRSGGSKTRKR